MQAYDGAVIAPQHIKVVATEAFEDVRERWKEYEAGIRPGNQGTKEGV